MNLKWIMPALLMLSASAWAQEAAEAAHEAEGAVEIPWNSLWVQTFNLVFLLVLLGWVLRKPVKEHFKQRAQTYRELVDRADVARREAEQANKTIKERLAKLESTADQSVSQARSEAADLKAKLMTEAKDLVKKLEEEAKRSATMELEKAKAELRRELLDSALAKSEETLKKGLGSSDQKNLQNEFAQKIGVVTG